MGASTAAGRYPPPPQAGTPDPLCPYAPSVPHTADRARRTKVVGGIGGSGVDLSCPQPHCGPSCRGWLPHRPENTLATSEPGMSKRRRVRETAPSCTRAGGRQYPRTRPGTASCAHRTARPPADHHARSQYRAPQRKHVQRRSNPS
eukprot:1428143-Rhodomonas_salina.3